MINPTIAPMTITAKSAAVRFSSRPIMIWAAITLANVMVLAMDKSIPPVSMVRFCPIAAIPIKEASLRIPATWVGFRYPGDIIWAASSNTTSIT